MGAVCPFPEPFEPYEPLVFGEYSEHDWSPSDSQESLDEAMTRFGLTESGEQSFYRDPGMGGCVESPDSGSYLDAPNAWQMDSQAWHPRNGPLYDLKIPSKASACGAWPHFDHETSCSGVGSWSPHTPDSRSEVGGTYTQHHSPWDRGSISIPFGGLSQYHAHGSYHPSTSTAVISPQELQHHHDDYLEVSSPRTDLQGIGVGQSYYPEDVAVYSQHENPEHYCHKDEGIGSSIQSLKEESVAASIKDEDDMEEDAVYDDDEDWSPQVEKQGQVRRLSRRSTATKSPANGTAKRSHRTKFATSQAPRPTRIAKKAQKPPIIHHHQSNRNGANMLPCPHCSQRFPSDSTLKKHILASHTRPFICTFHNYGCDSTVGSKNEWKRHINVQHMHLETWRCDIGACAAPACAPDDLQQNGRRISSSHTASIAGPLDNAASQHHDFDRKDLFTQHMKRMHSPAGSASRADKLNFEASIEEAQKRCYLKLREPPVNTICPFCPDHPAFESWDDRIEHVGKHLEKNDVDRTKEVEDLVLMKWLKDAGYVQPKGSGWKLIDTGKKKKRTIKKEDDDEGDEDAEGEYE